MRIRTIKPEFWTDEKIGSLSLGARLLFISLWNVADDSGNFADKPKQLKIQTMPYDTIDISELLLELVSSNLIVRYEVNDKSYYHIINFLKHQKINRPSPPIYPPFTELSVSTHTLLTDNSLGKEGRKEGKERKGNNNNNFNLDICIDIFCEHGLTTDEAKLYYSDMEKLNWLNQYNELITDKIRYTIQTVKQRLYENNERTTKRNTTNFQHKSSRSIETEPTRAELRKLQKR
jgi:hypothetical protein